MVDRKRQGGQSAIYEGNGMNRAVEAHFQTSHTEHLTVGTFPHSHPTPISPFFQLLCLWRFAKAPKEQ
ncbi:MAG: hypothetical protein KME08_12125, partial [Aphanothece sp. CMT-3BRIN-NPC111]|nr:hypothetical protein [Aphanothece sp. CMT-3BRIN-NPC111]